MLTVSAMIIGGPAISEECTGSGCAVSDDLILTAFHVVEDATKIQVAFGENLIEAKLIDSDESADWAMLRIKGHAPAFVVPDTKGATVLGGKIYTLGYPTADILGQSVKYTDGSISALRGLRGDVRMLQVTVPVQPGNSGGPLFDESGRLVGLISSSIDPEMFLKITGGALPQNVNFALKSSVVPREYFKGVETNFVDVSRNKSATCFIKCNIPKKRLHARAERMGEKDKDSVKDGRRDFKIPSFVGIPFHRPYAPPSYHKKIENDSKGFAWKFVPRVNFLEFDEWKYYMDDEQKYVVTIVGRKDLGECEVNYHDRTVAERDRRLQGERFADMINKFTNKFGVKVSKKANEKVEYNYVATIGKTDGFYQVVNFTLYKEKQYYPHWVVEIQIDITEDTDAL